VPQLGLGLIAPRITLAPFLGYLRPLADHPELNTSPGGVRLYFVPDRAMDVGAALTFTDLSRTPSPRAPSAGTWAGSAAGGR
jgi:hypothetical protein